MGLLRGQCGSAGRNDRSRLRLKHLREIEIPFDDDGETGLPDVGFGQVQAV